MRIGGMSERRVARSIATLGLSAVCSITCKVLSFEAGPYYTGSRSLFYAGANSYGKLMKLARRVVRRQRAPPFYSKIYSDSFEKL